MPCLLLWLLYLLSINRHNYQDYGFYYALGGSMHCRLGFLVVNLALCIHPDQMLATDWHTVGCPPINIFIFNE